MQQQYGSDGTSAFPPSSKGLFFQIHVVKSTSFKETGKVVNVRRCDSQRRSGGGVYRYIIPPKSVYLKNFYVVVLSPWPLILKLQWLV